MKLRIHPVPHDSDIYRDIVRVPQAFRKTTDGRLISDGKVCKLTANGRTCRAIVRGLGDCPDPVITIDEKLRGSLGVDLGASVEVELKPEGFVGQWCWAWSASDPSYQIAGRLGVLSVVLGAVGLCLGIISLVVTFK